MPLYEFYCSECRKKTEELCSSSINSVNCQFCGKNAHRVFSTFRTSSDGSISGQPSSSCGG